jgi:hypothetical protein
MVRLVISKLLSWIRNGVLSSVPACSAGRPARSAGRIALEDAEDGAARHAEAAGEGIDGKALAAPQPYDLLVAPSRAQAAHTAGLVVAAERQGAVEAGGREVAALVSILDVLRQGVAPGFLRIVGFGDRACCANL